MAEHAELLIPGSTPRSTQSTGNAAGREDSPNRLHSDAEIGKLQSEIDQLKLDAQEMQQRSEESNDKLLEVKQQVVVAIDIHLTVDNSVIGVAA